MSDRAENGDKEADLEAKRREVEQHQREKYMRTMASRGDVVQMTQVYHSKWVVPLMQELRALKMRVDKLEGDG